MIRNPSLPTMNARPSIANVVGRCPGPLGGWARVGSLLLAWLAVAAIAMPMARAQVTAPPDSLPYHGYLADADGVGLGSPTPANYDVVFRIFNAASGGTLMWSEQQTVTFDGGHFSVELGMGGSVGIEPRPTLSSIFRSPSASERHVEVTVKGVGPDAADHVVVPRVRLLSSPYALLARHAITADALISGETTSALAISGNRVGINKALLAAELNGANSLAMPSTTFGGAITVEAWVNPRSHALWQRIADIGNGPQADNIILAASVGYSGRPIFQVYSGNNPVITLEAPSDIPLNTWTHVAGVLDQDLTGRLFINGQMVASGKATALPPTVARANGFIGKSNWPDALLDGALTDLRIWNVARTAAEIQGAMTAGAISGPTAGLVAAYPFGLTGATSLADISGNSRNLTSSGTVNFPKVASQPGAELDVNGNVLGGGIQVTEDLAVAGTLTADSWEGLGIVPVGTVILWSGDSAPDDWALCDGQVVNGVQTPDLRGRFVLGLGQGPGLTERRIGERGGFEQHALLAVELPTHEHAYPGSNAFSTTSGGEHHHSLMSMYTDVGGPPSIPREEGGGRSFGLLAHVPVDNLTRFEGEHSHRLDLPGVQTSPQGEGAPHPNMPPFYALAYIMRIR